MSLFKELSEKAKNTAKMVGEKSADLVETKKLQFQVSQMEGEAKKLKTELGELYYEAFASEESADEEKVKTLLEGIQKILEAVKGLKEQLEKEK